MTSERRRYQDQVAALLETIGQGVQKLERLRAHGVRGRGLLDDEAELAVARQTLAALVRSRENQYKASLGRAGRGRTPQPGLSVPARGARAPALSLQRPVGQGVVAIVRTPVPCRDRRGVTSSTFQIGHM